MRDARAKEEDARQEALLLEVLAAQRLPLDAGFHKALDAKVGKIVDKRIRRARR